MERRYHAYFGHLATRWTRPFPVSRHVRLGEIDRINQDSVPFGAKGVVRTAA